ncbi:MAG: hypothetical protein A2X49_00320 [Lentisphaerae bacterium GWF2_52_8]|nr:MAG: hypothetical protein A2X49_00320 [Lentisphaerae bacterium GWF2_52_8]
MPERVAKIAEAGFRNIETWKNKAEDLQPLSKACTENGVSLVSVVLSFPSAKETALTTPSTHGAFLEAFDRNSDAALAAGCSSGIVCTGNTDLTVNIATQKQYVIDALQKAAPIAEKKGFSIHVEALNTKVNHAGYFLDDPNTGYEIIKAVGSSRVKLLFDIYHMQIMHGFLTNSILDNLDLISHFHAAGVPGRHELINNEINYRFLAEKIALSSYSGYFGLEYFPELPSADSLAGSAKLFNGLL